MTPVVACLIIDNIESDISQDVQQTPPAPYTALVLFIDTPPIHHIIPRPLLHIPAQWCCGRVEYIH